MLFTQLALAAYNCPLERVDQRAAMEAPDCCDSVTKATTSICHEYCKGNQATTPDTPSDLPGFVPTFALKLPQPSATLSDVTYSHAVLGKAASPPLSILNCCFRI
jgi:hypothetical protein